MEPTRPTHLRTTRTQDRSCSLPPATPARSRPTTRPSSTDRTIQSPHLDNRRFFLLSVFLRRCFATHPSSTLLQSCRRRSSDSPAPKHKQQYSTSKQNQGHAQKPSAVSHVGTSLLSQFPRCLTGTVTFKTGDRATVGSPLRISTENATRTIQVSSIPMRQGLN